MFNIRLVTLDHYISKPIDDIYVDDENIIRERQEPVLRIFGSTPDGVKSCVHVHGVYPYMYVPFEGGENPDREALLLGAVLDEALKNTITKKNFRYVHKVTLVSGIPLYGYHSKHRQFFKIYFYNPFHIRKASELLLSGAILGQKFQPHEAHIPYALQFMMDYNIYGMSFVTFAKVKYRRNPDNPDSLLGVTKEDILSNKVKKMTWCYLEVDAWASDIINRTKDKEVGGNPGLRAIWEEEKVRRRVQGRVSQMTIPESESRPAVKMCATEVMYKERLTKKLENVFPQRVDVSSGSRTATFPELGDTGGILEVSSLEEGIEHPQPKGDFHDVSTLIDETILTRIAESQGGRPEDESENEEDGMEADSVLGRNQEEEEEAEQEDEEGDMTQPLEGDENAACNPDSIRDEPGGSSGDSEEAFWRSMADKIFQLDGAHDSSSESDADGSNNNPCRVEIPVNAGLSELENPDDLRLSPTWSGTIMSILSEDSACPTPSTVCQTPQTFWSNYSPKMDSWLSQNSESWNWNKSGMGFDCFSGKSHPEDSTAFPGNESSNDLSYVSLFASNEKEYFSSPAVTPLYPAGFTPEISPPSAILTPASEVDSSDINLDTICENVLDCPSPPTEDKQVQSKKVRESETVFEKSGDDGEKLRNILENFSSESVPLENNRRLTFCLTLKQYIKDCKEIVSVDFKNLCNREMVIIEYKSLNKRSVQNKFLIKPLDKFLEKWTAAERKANEQLSNRPKVINGFNVSGEDERKSLRSVMNILERKSSKLKSIKNKFTVKSMEILRDELTPRHYNVNENVISQGKIKMKLIKSQSENFEAEATPAVGFKPCSVCPNRVDGKKMKTGKSVKGESDERGAWRKERAKVTHSECKKNLRKADKWRNFSELDAKLIKEINTSFEEYFKNIVKLNNISGKRRRIFPERLSDDVDMAEESTEDEKEEREMRQNPLEDVLSSPTVDSIKFVSRFLSSLSQMSQSRDMPPVSITISLGNTCNPAPVQVNVQPTVPLPRVPSKRPRRKTKIENVDGPADGSSSDESSGRDPRRQSPNVKKRKRESFYKPLNVVVQGTPSSSRETRKKRKIPVEEEEPKKSSAHFSRGIPGGEKGNSKRENPSEVLVTIRKRTPDGEDGSGKSSGGVSTEPDFIYDSDGERKSEKLRSRRWPKMKRSSRFKKIPQADTEAATTSDDDNLEVYRRKILNLPPEKLGEVSEKEIEGPRAAEKIETPEDSGPSLPADDSKSPLNEPSVISLIPRAADSPEGVNLIEPTSLPSWPGSEDLMEEAGISFSSPQTQTAFPLSGSPLFQSGKSSEGSTPPFSRSLIDSLKKPDRSEVSPIQVSSESDDKSKDQTIVEVGVDWVVGSRRLMPKRKPLSRNEVLEWCRQENLGNSEEAAFYGDPRDLTKAMETGPRTLKIGSLSTSGLKTFKSSLEILGTDERRNQLLNLPKGERGMKRFLLVGDRDVRITPLRNPPTVGSAVEWLEKKRKGEVREQTEKPKVKIVKPLSPGQEGDSDDEMELSVTMSSFADVSEKKASAEDESVGGYSGAGGSRSEDREILGRKGPLSKVKGIKRLSLLKKFGGIPTAEEKQPLEASSHSSSSGGSKRNSDNSFQIRGVTLENTLGFSGSVENQQNVKLNHTHQHLSVLVMEVHVQTRKDLRPDPDHDPVRALFYTITFDSPAKDQETGVIVVGEKLLSGTAVSSHVVHYVPTEKDLFEKTVALLRAWDPDILAGYEIEMRSWGYFVQRGFVLELNLLWLLGRLQGEDFSQWKKEADSPADEWDDIPRNIRHMKIPGRIILDIWRLFRHEVALTSYSFENVMYHLSHERHPLFSYRTLSRFWEHPNSRFRHITVEHYMKRVLGVIKLLDQLDFINRTSELSRLFGIQFYEVLSRGSQFRVESMMLRLAKPLNYVPVSPSVAQRAEMRAPASLPLILEPESFFYTDPVIVLDFQSLYPSMIIAYNYCFSTCLGRVEHLGGSSPFEFGCTELQISPEELKALEEDITISPAGVAFVKSNIRKGVLPTMLEEILETRLMVKKAMKENKDNKVLQKVLFARQLGLKLIANVTYGYTAANFSGRMPCIEVGDSVVSKGRETLHRAIQLIKNNPKWGARVVYGDTDSVFVLTPGRTREEAFKIGAEIAEAVTQDNPKPVKLKLEKVYQPSILQTKKRYVGYMYETPEQEKPVLESKGIETVRRDGCPATAKILEKALRILFDTKDVSLVKKYTVRQFAKLFQGRVNMTDVIFAKEYRGRRGYRPGACVPALQLARQWTQEDKRAEPRVKERVPYVIVNGPPGVPLIRLVRSPVELLTDPSLRINAAYYITKAIIPPMQRCFSLLGADVSSWYSEVPRKYHKAHKPTLGEGQKRSTISQYFAATECVVCSKVTNAAVCPECERQPQTVTVCCADKVRRWERSHAQILKICQSCCGRTTELDCLSLDCPVLYRRNQAAKDLEQVSTLRQILTRYLSA